MAGRPKSANESEKVHPTLSKQLVGYLEDLVDIGGYGNSKTDVARYLIQREIDDLLRANVLIPSRKGDD